MVEPCLQIIHIHQDYLISADLIVFSPGAREVIMKNMGTIDRYQTPTDTAERKQFAYLFGWTAYTFVLFRSIILMFSPCLEANDRSVIVPLCMLLWTTTRWIWTYQERPWFTSRDVSQLCIYWRVHDCITVLIGTKFTVNKDKRNVHFLFIITVNHPSKRDIR